jgi:signal transduction histidine kinase
VSHSLAMIAMQSGGARAIMRRNPARAEASLESIEHAARDGLTEMRRLLGLIGHDSEEAELSPQPGIDQLEALVERSRGAGLAVSLEFEGDPRPAPAAVDLSAYRIVQEALTNAAKHSGRCTVRVEVRWQPTNVELEITNDGTGKAAGGGEPTGHGLVGMRERVALVGGEVEAGPRRDGSYRVRARLPLESSS